MNSLPFKTVLKITGKEQGRDMKNSADLVREHFEKRSKEFDSIYSGKKGRVGRFLDDKLRWDMKKRLERTLEECRDAGGKTIIDIGCGSGRFMESLQNNHPRLILGIDFAPRMIFSAQANVNPDQPDAPCRFVVGDFNQMQFKTPFDISLAIGLFDYVEHPLSMLQRIRAATRDKMIASFPREGTLRSQLRKWRLSYYSCPVYFYSTERVKDLLEEAGFSDIKQETFGQLIFVVAR